MEKTIGIGHAVTTAHTKVEVIGGIEIRTGTARDEERNLEGMRVKRLSSYILKSSFWGL
jgi:hypothetical protein